jgi:hypothetical protein
LSCITPMPMTIVIEKIKEINLPRIYFIIWSNILTHCWQYLWKIKYSRKILLKHSCLFQGRSNIFICLMSCFLFDCDYPLMESLYFSSHWFLLSSHFCFMFIFDVSQSLFFPFKFLASVDWVLLLLYFLSFFILLVTSAAFQNVSLIYLATMASFCFLFIVIERLSQKLVSF